MGNATVKQFPFLGSQQRIGFRLVPYSFDLYHFMLQWSFRVDFYSTWHIRIPNPGAGKNAGLLVYLDASFPASFSFSLGDLRTPSQQHHTPWIVQTIARVERYG